MRAIFGGSFDPVHIGHLRMAVELAEALRLEQVSLMPCYTPVHKGGLAATPAQRLAMLELAVSDNPRLRIDRREMERSGPSFTYESLKMLREESDTPVLLVMGSDSALGLADWHKAEAFADFCHLVVLERPAVGLDAEVQGNWMRTAKELGFSQVRVADALESTTAGSVLPLRLNLLDVSSTYIRNAVKQNRSIRYLVTDAVERYICDNGLYTANLGGSPR